MSDHYGCDYCGEDPGSRFYLRAVGFTRLTDDGPRSPLVKEWCGRCPTPDDIDPEADAALGAATASQVTR